MDLAGVRKTLERIGRLIFVEADEPCEIPDTIRRRAAGVDLIVIGGGDGTLNRAAEVLMEIDQPVGILPLGTANNLARSLGIPLDPISACKAMATCEPLPMHPGLVNRTPFFTVAHIGLGARIDGRLSERGKKRWGILSHVLSAARSLKSGSSFLAAVYHDRGHKILKAIEIGVAIARYYGPGIPVEDESVVDQRFHVFLIEPQSLLGFLAEVPHLLAGRIGCGPHADRFRTAELYVESDRPIKISADGEIIQETPARFRIASDAVRFMTPRGSCVHRKRREKQCSKMQESQA